MMHKSKSIEIFCCYALEDECYFEELNKHLKTLLYQGLIVLHSDTDISPGADWKEQISRYIKSSQIILLLISPDFIASEYCHGAEKQINERYQTSEVRVIPILLRTVFWEGTLFNHLQPLPAKDEPLANQQGHSRDDAWVAIIKGIRRVLEELEVEDTASAPMKDRETHLIHPQIGKGIRSPEQDIQQINILLGHYRFEIKQHLFNAISTFYMDLPERVSRWGERYIIQDPLKRHELFSRNAVERICLEIQKFLTSQVKAEADKWVQTTMQPLLTNRFGTLSLELQGKILLFLDSLEQVQSTESSTNTVKSMTSIVEETLANMGCQNSSSGFDEILESFVPPLITEFMTSLRFLSPPLLASFFVVPTVAILFIDDINKRIIESITREMVRSAQDLRDERTDIANRLVDKLDQQLYEMQQTLYKALTAATQ